jgi:hypothetical protein
MTLTVASLCSGIEATSLGLHLAGLQHRLAYVADNDPAAAKVLAHHHPDVPNPGNISTADWATVERVSLMHMGFPCTDLSCAGGRAGLGVNSRSGVWANCAQAISATRPPLALIENVPGLLSTPANRSTDAPDSDLEPGRQAWETGQADLFSGHSEPYSETWPTSGMTRSGCAYPLPAWAHPTSATASSSSPGTPQPKTTGPEHPQPPRRTCYQPRKRRTQERRAGGPGRGGDRPCRRCCST